LSFDRQHTNGESTGGELKYNKSSAVAEMGDREHNRHGSFRFVIIIRNISIQPTT